MRVIAAGVAAMVLAAAPHFVLQLSGVAPEQAVQVSPGNTIRASDFENLRRRVDDLRQARGLAPLTWTNPSLSGIPIRTVHIHELREALRTIYAHDGMAAPSFTNPVNVGDPVRAIDFNELLAPLVALEPVAAAGPDRSVDVGSVVILDGTGSSHPQGRLLSFRWSVISRPSGSIAALLNATTVAPSFTPDVVGPYGIELVVNDGIVFSPPDRLTITAVLGPPGISGFSPASTSIGGLVTITGRNLAPVTGAPTIRLTRQGGGTIAAPVSAFASASLSFVVPTQALTGLVTVDVAGRAVSSASPLTIQPSSDFSVTAAPSSATLIQGRTVSYSVTVNSTTGFSQLANLAVTGLPSGMTASFVPTQVGVGHTALLTLQAPLGQPIGPAALTVSAAAVVDQVSMTRSTGFTVNVRPVTTSFLGRTVVDDPLQTALAGVTVSMLGRDGAGNANGCVGATVSDTAGNFALTNLPASCAGPQLIRYDGSTATAPPGEYAGVDLFYQLTLDAVTVSPVLVHLPRIDRAETVSVVQNAPTDQTFVFTTIPNLSVTVYAGTVFTLMNGSQPNPFPLTAIQVPIDRLPEEMPPMPGVVGTFIVAFQPANATASQPVAVSFPNVFNSPPAARADLSTLDPTRGVMVNYGTGTVSFDGRQVVPDFNPATPGKRYGIVNFDWHGPLFRPFAGNPENPSPDCDAAPSTRQPVDLSSGIEVIRATDLSITGLRGDLTLQRVYRTMSAEAGPFGIGGNHNYGFRLDTNTPQAVAVVNLVMPDGNRFPFSLNAAGRYVNASICKLRGIVLTVAGTGESDLRFKDGTVYHFSPRTALLGSVLRTVTDSNGNVVTVTRNPSNAAQITRISDPVGRALTLAYDGANRITSVTDPLGRRVSYTYNAFGTLQTVTDPLGAVTRYDYSAADRLTRVTDARGVVVVENAYDANGRVIRQTYADGGVLTIAYTLANTALGAASPVLASMVTDPLSNATTYRFNPEGYLLGVTDPLGQVRIFDREQGTNKLNALRGRGQCDVCGDPARGDLSFTYDANANLLTTTDGLGNTTTFTYEPAFHKVTSVTDPAGNVTRFTYDGSGNLASIRDARGNTTSLTYDANGLPLTITDPQLAAWTLTYDASGNMTTMTDPLAHAVRLQYDGVSRPVQVTDALGRRTRVSYDLRDRIVGQTDARGATTRVAYDPIGNVLSVTDARSNATSFAYDATGRLQVRTDSRGNADRRVYDLNDNLTGFTDRRSQASTYTYDALGRLVTEAYADGSRVTREYDGEGRLIQAVDSISGTFAKDYDLAGRLLSEIGPQGTVVYTRDPLGRVSRRQVVGQSPVTYAYDAAGNQTSVSSPEAAVSFTYDSRNQVAAESRMNGVVTTYSYDRLGRVLRILHARGATVLDNQTYAYDAVGNIVQKTTNVAQPLTTTSSINAYDALSNRLTQWGPTTYTHDANGNRLTETGPGGTTTYTWDARNRLRAIAQPSGGVKTFSYDFVGNLIEGVTSGAAPASRAYLLDDLANVVQLTDSPGQRLSVLSGRVMDQHVAMTTPAGASSYRLTDQINSTTQIVDASGVSQGLFLYEPFGAATTTGNDYPFEFAGQSRIGNGVYQNRSGYYDAVTGRLVNNEDRQSLANSPINSFLADSGDASGEISWFALDQFAIDPYLKKRQQRFLSLALKESFTNNAAKICRKIGYWKLFAMSRVVRIGWAAAGTVMNVKDIYDFIDISVDLGRIADRIEDRDEQDQRFFDQFMRPRFGGNSAPAEPPMCIEPVEPLMCLQ